MTARDLAVGGFVAGDSAGHVYGVCDYGIVAPFAGVEYMDVGRYDHYAVLFLVVDMVPDATSYDAVRRIWHT